MKQSLSPKNRPATTNWGRPLMLAFWMAVQSIGVVGFSQTDESERRVSVETIAGETAMGVLESISSAGIVKLADGQSWQISELLSLAMSGSDSGATLGFPRILLVDGGEVAMKTATFAGENLTIDDSIIRSVMPPEIVRGIQWKSEQTAEVALQNPRTDRDRVVVMGEEQPVTLDGIIEGFDAERLVINYDGQSRSIQVDKILAVVFADLQQGSRPASSVKAIFSNGSRLDGNVHEWRDGKLVFSVRGSLLKVEASELIRLEIRSDRLQYISDLADLEVESKPIFAPPRSWQRDRSIEGNPLRLLTANGDVQVFRRGLGVAAYSRVSFLNSGNFNLLSGTVGIDAETEGRGNCRVLIRGDGVTLLDRHLLATQPAEPFDLDISGVSRIELIVEPGELFDLSDHVSWANLRMIKKD